jgi:hypothetical protein
VLVTPTPTITPTGTVTSTRTATRTRTQSPTATPTPLPLDNFQCHRTQLMNGTRFTLLRDMSSRDTFGALTLSVKRPVALCNPADIEDADPSAPGHAEHLESYTIATSTGSQKFTARINRQVANRFGTVSLDVTRPLRLLMPDLRSLSSAPAPFNPRTDSFTCYSVRLTQGGTGFIPSTDVSVEDEFRGTTADLMRPTMLCAPTSLNGAAPAAPTHALHLLCYKIRTTRVAYSPTILVRNDFGTEALNIIAPGELCVASFVGP